MAERTAADRLAGALREPTRPGPALVAYLAAGYPDAAGWERALVAAAEAAELVEVGVPFSDPMADGVTIQRASRTALAGGVRLAWIFDRLEALRGELASELVLMSYLNPLLAFGTRRLVDRCTAAGVAGLVVPDLPLEESGELAEPLADAGLGLVQLVTPVTPPDRLARLCAASRGFVYAVTATGTTGRRDGLGPAVGAYLDRVRASASLPVCAGFGVRSPADVAALAPHADGVIVGSALIEALEAGRGAGEFLRGLRAAPTAREASR
jgi:tryptophan synthase alpha chain